MGFLGDLFFFLGFFFGEFDDLRITSLNAYFRCGIPRLVRGASPCFSEKVLCAGKGLRPPFKIVSPPKKPVTPKFDTGTYGYFVCLYRGVPMPVSETIWRGKVGTPEKCACILIVPVSGVTVSGIHCNFIETSRYSITKRKQSCGGRNKISFCPRNHEISRDRQGTKSRPYFLIGRTDVSSRVRIYYHSPTQSKNIS